MPFPLPRRKTVLFRLADLKTAAAALLLAAASLGLSGCPGELDPRLLNSGPQVCNAAAFMKGTTCSMAGCHYMTVPAGGLDLFSDGVVQRLVGRMPDPTNTTSSCMANTTPYLIQGSSPVMGLLLDKLKDPSPCGLPMPYPGLMLLPASDLACITEWSQAAVNGEL